MLFEDTHIVIRERGFAELMDLALKVVRAHTGPLVMAGLVGVLPWAVLNMLFLGNFVLDQDIWDRSGWFVYWMILAVAAEAPLATAGITLYLGQATFQQQIDPGRIFRDYWRSMPQMLISLCVRAVLAVTVVGLMLPYGFYPYRSELILLERTSYFSGKQKRITTGRRSRNLHRSSGGDIFGYWMASCLVGAVLTLILIGGLHTAAGQLAGYQVSQANLILYLFPASLWTATCFFAVVRFLAYLDLRIKREGWEVELTMRNEAARLARGLA